MDQNTGCADLKSACPLRGIIERLFGRRRNQISLVGHVRPPKQVQPAAIRAASNGEESPNFPRVSQKFVKVTVDNLLRRKLR